MLFNKREGEKFYCFFNYSTFLYEWRTFEVLSSSKTLFENDFILIKITHTFESPTKFVDKVILKIGFSFKFQLNSNFQFFIPYDFLCQLLHSQVDEINLSLPIFCKPFCLWWLADTLLTCAKSTEKYFCCCKWEKNLLCKCKLSVCCQLIEITIDELISGQTLEKANFKIYYAGTQQLSIVKGNRRFQSQIRYH